MIRLSDSAGHTLTLPDADVRITYCDRQQPVVVPSGSFTIAATTLQEQSLRDCLGEWGVVVGLAVRVRDRRARPTKPPWGRRRRKAVAPNRMTRRKHLQPRFTVDLRAFCIRMLVVDRAECGSRSC